MKIDLQSPAEVWRCQLPESADEPCEVTLFNLAEQRIVSVELTLIFVDQSGAELQRLVERGHDLAGDPGESFVMLMQVPPGMLSDATHHIEVTVEKVWFQDGIVWRRTRGTMVEYQSNALPRGRERNMLTFIAGQDAIGYPVRQGKLWLCVCGRPNAEETATCARCKRDRDLVFENCSPEAVAAAMARQEERLHETLQSATRLGSGDNRDFIRRKKDHTKLIGSLIIILLLGVLGWVSWTQWISPAMDYRKAVSLTESGDYTAAAGIFTRLGDYRDSARQAADASDKAHYAEASRLLESGQYDQARAAFEALGGYRDSAAMVTETDYRKALHTLEEGNPTDAQTAFEALAEIPYKDSKDQVFVCRYQQAEQKFNSGRWLEAAEAWEAIADYSDSAGRAKIARYSRAEEALAEEAWQEAHDIWIALGTYADSADRAREALYTAGCAQEDPEEALKWLDSEELNGYSDVEALRQERWYTLGQRRMEAGDAYAAGEAFARAGDYEDAKDQVMACIYKPARDAMNSGDYAAAAALFERIPDYQDAAAQRVTCIKKQAAAAAAAGDWKAAVAFCELILDDNDAALMRLEYLTADARRARDEKDYTEAMRLLGLLPEENAEVAALKLECVYLQAGDKVTRGEWASAAVDYEELAAQGYRDAAELALFSHYKEAQGYFNDKDYAAAYEVYTVLGTYRDSEAKAREARYRMALALEISARYTEAEPIFRELGTYSDAADHLRQVSYSIAMADLSAGDYAKARDRFAALDNYADSKTQVLACDYAKADALEREGNREAAASSFEDLKDYADAADRAKEIRYAIAEEAWSAGDTGRAAAIYSSLGDYSESASRLAEIQDQVYGGPAAVARAALDAGDAALAASVLDALDLSALPERYAELRELWHEACYTEGKRLLAAGDPDGAYPYLQRCAGHLDTDTLMNREDWNILGTWSDGTTRLILRKQGTLTIDGETLPYTKNGYSIEVTITGENARVTRRQYFKLVSIDDSRMVLRDLRSDPEGRLILNRVARDELQALPAMPTATPTDLQEAAPPEAEALPADTEEASHV